MTQATKNAPEDHTMTDGFRLLWASLLGKYGNKLTTQFEGVDPAIVETVWIEQIGTKLAWRQCIREAVLMAPPTFPPTAGEMAQIFDSIRVPQMAIKQETMITKQLTAEEEIARQKMIEHHLKLMREFCKNGKGGIQIIRN